MENKNKIHKCTMLMAWETDEVSKVLNIVAVIMLITWILFALIIYKTNPVHAHIEKTTALCQNLYFTDEARAKQIWCNMEQISNIIDIVHEWNEPTVEERAFKLIVKYEWFSDKPYWDQKQWSCWYWMRCSENTTWITKEKSKVLVIERIKHIRERYKFYDLSDDIEVWLISFTYNIWHPPKWYKRFIDNWYVWALQNRMKEYTYAGWEYLNWLYTRRLDESSFLN